MAGTATTSTSRGRVACSARCTRTCGAPIRAVAWLDAAAEPLSAVLERVRHTVRPGSLVIVISDFFGLDEDCNRHLSRLRQHNDIIGCQILDAAEEHLPRGRYRSSKCPSLRM